MNTRHFAFAAALLLAGCARASDNAASSAAADDTTPDAGTEPETFSWPVPAHWAPETDPFPLSFAPTLPYPSGVLELRFPAGFMTTTADAYFSYSYAWQLDGSPTFTADSLSRDLATYYSGLAQSADPDHFDGTVHHAEIAATATGFRGVVHTADGFNNSIPLTLNADVALTSCGGKFIALFTMSPHPFDDATYSAMLAQRATFSCNAGSTP